MLNEEEENTHNQINTQLKYEEEKEYWQDKLLELKMKEKKDFYYLNQSKTRLEEDLSKESQRNDILTNEYNILQDQLSQLRKSQQTIDDKLTSIDIDTKEINQANEDLIKQIMERTEYLHQLNTTDSLINHFLSFPPEFTKQVYALCTERVNAALQYKAQMSYQNQHQHQPNNNQTPPLQNGNQSQYIPHDNEMKPPQAKQPNQNYPMIFYPVYHPYQNNYPHPQ